MIEAKRGSSLRSALVSVLALGICMLSPVAAVASPAQSPTAAISDAAAYGYDLSGPADATTTVSVTELAPPAIVLSSSEQRFVYDSPTSSYATNTPATTLYHYTDEAGQAGIVSSGELRPSLASVNPNDVRYGNGQYLSDIMPGTQSCAQLSRCFLGQPFQGQRFTNFVEIDVSGLNVIKGRSGVFVIPGDEPLDLLGRIVGVGVN